MQQMWLAKTSRKTQQPGRYQTALGMVFYNCSDHLPQAYTGSSTHKLLLDRRETSRRKERNQAKLDFHPLVQTLYERDPFQKDGRRDSDRKWEQGGRK